MDDLGSRIRALRIQRNLTQEELLTALFHRFGFRVARETLSKWENGKQKPSVYAVQSLARIYEVSIEDLVYGQETVEPGELLHPSLLPIRRRKIPVLGEVVCGEPSYAMADYDTYISVDADVQADFALRAKGDSMTGSRIYDGDLVFVRRQDDVRDGEIAVVLLDDETTLKRVYKFADGTSELRADNPLYPPIRIGGASETRTVRILGRAVAFQSGLL